MTTKELLDEALSLPVETRVLIADTLLRSLTGPDPQVEKEWVDIAKSRRSELESGAAESVPVSRILEGVRDRLSS